MPEDTFMKRAGRFMMQDYGVQGAVSIIDAIRKEISGLRKAQTTSGISHAPDVRFNASRVAPSPAEGGRGSLVKDLMDRSITAGRGFFDSLEPQYAEEGRSSRPGECMYRSPFSHSQQ